VIADQAGMASTRLAEAVGYPGSSVAFAQLLSGMERDGLIEPVGARGDRRKLAYRLTAAGRGELDRWLDEPEVEPQPLREGIYLKLLLSGRLGNGNLGVLLARQRRAQLQRLHDYGDLERRARRE